MIYEPAEDSELIKKHIANYARGSVLDVGTGSAILAKEAARYAKSVLAVDINPKAIKKPSRNITYKQSDLFSNVKGKFDCILFNPPYLPNDKGIEDIALYGGKKGYEVIMKFLEDAPAHLKKKGMILLLFSSFSKPRSILKKMRELNYNFELVDQTHISFEDLYVYKLWRE